MGRSWWQQLSCTKKKDADRDSGEETFIQVTEYLSEVVKAQSISLEPKTPLSPYSVEFESGYNSHIPLSPSTPTPPFSASSGNIISASMIQSPQLQSARATPAINAWEDPNPNRAFKNPDMHQNVTLKGKGGINGTELSHSVTYEEETNDRVDSNKSSIVDLTFASLTGLNSGYNTPVAYDSPRHHTKRQVSNLTPPKTSRLDALKEEVSDNIESNRSSSESNIVDLTNDSVMYLHPNIKSGYRVSLSTSDSPKMMVKHPTVRERADSLSQSSNVDSNKSSIADLTYASFTGLNSGYSTPVEADSPPAVARHPTKRQGSNLTPPRITLKLDALEEETTDNIESNRSGAATLTSNSLYTHDTMGLEYNSSHKDDSQKMLPKYNSPGRQRASTTPIPKVQKPYDQEEEGSDSLPHDPFDKDMMELEYNFYSSAVSAEMLARHLTLRIGENVESSSESNMGDLTNDSVIYPHPKMKSGYGVSHSASESPKMMPRHFTVRERAESLPQSRKDLTSNAINDNESLATIRHAAGIFMQGGIINHLKKEVDALRITTSAITSRTHSLEKETNFLVRKTHSLEKECEGYVKYNQVSEAVKENPFKQQQSEQQKNIHADQALNAYCNAFQSYFSSAFTSAQSIVRGEVALNTNSLIDQGLSMALNSIPFCGSTISEIFTVCTSIYRGKSITNNATLFLKIAVNHTNLDLIIKKVVYDITLHDTKKQEILSPKVLHKDKGLIDQFIAKYKEIKKIVDKVIKGEELYNTQWAKLAAEDAINAISAFLKHAKEYQGFFEPDLVEKILKEAILPDAVWSSKASLFDLPIVELSFDQCIGGTSTPPVFSATTESFA